MTSRARRRAAWAAGTAVLVATLAALVGWLNVRGEQPIDDAVEPVMSQPEAIARGAYLARAGNCIGCHTSAGGARFAGGRGVETPFGVVFAPNITPDEKTGIGRWSAGEFWRAMHHGRSKGGRLLYPAFPYPSFTNVTREDSDALYVYLRSVPPAVQANRPHALRFPYSTQGALAVWRALFFRPATLAPDAAQSSGWNRGRYLVQGLGHCAACHSGRNVLGGINAEFAGGLMPDASWYAPSLSDPQEAGVQRWPRAEVIRLLKNGLSEHASVSGPMADVVFTSTQYLAEDDLGAMALYLASLPVTTAERKPGQPADAGDTLRGAKLYDQHCDSCHGRQGQGVDGIYPALAGNRAVTLPTPNNLVQMIRHGGFAPATSGNPRPFGMPPFEQLLDDAEIAAVATYIRQAWGNAAAPVSSLDVLYVR